MHDPSANRTSEDPLEAKAIEDLAELLSHFDILLGALTLLMLIAMNAIIVWLNRGNCSPIFSQKNLILCVMLSCNFAAVTLNSAALLKESQAINTAIAVANASGVSFATGPSRMNRASIQLDYKSQDQLRSARFYSIVASHQLAASFAFVVVAVCHAIKASVHLRDQSLASMRIVYSLQAVFRLALFVVSVSFVRMKVKLLFLNAEE
ncbi:hypothetical protein HDU77_007724 [Chytriomyces hyalinus]|nr:hypothetical protein HDU77_007724 [Chytriomyces hyalinus]